MRDQKITFELADVYPDGVPFGDLSEIVKALERSFWYTAKQNNRDLTDDDLKISVVGIERGSNRITIAASLPVAKAAGKVSRSIASSDFSGIPKQSRHGIRTLWNLVNSKNWPLSFIPNSNDVVSATISPTDELLRPSEVSGYTTIYGKCERVGGDPKHSATVVLLSGERRSVGLRSREIAKELGERLFEVVGLEGVARWNFNDWGLESFVVDKISPYVETDAVKAFESLATAAGDRWDSIDPDEYVSDIRQ